MLPILSHGIPSPSSSLLTVLVSTATANPAQKGWSDQVMGMKTKTGRLGATQLGQFLRKDLRKAVLNAIFRESFTIYRYPRKSD